jgi:hypothetical protein
LFPELKARVLRRTMMRPPSRSAPGVLYEEERPLGVHRHEPVLVVLGHLADQARQPARRVDDHDF